MALADTLQKRIDEGKTRPTNEARLKLEESEVKEAIRTLKENRNSDTAIANALNEEFSPSFKTHETSSTEQFFKGKKQPEGAYTKEGRVYYKTISKFTSKMIKDTLDAWTTEVIEPREGIDWDSLNKPKRERVAKNFTCPECKKLLPLEQRVDGFKICKKCNIPQSEEEKGFVKNLKNLF